MSKRYFNYYFQVYNADDEYFLKNVEYEKEHARDCIKKLENEINRLTEYIDICNKREDYIKTSIVYQKEVVIERGHDYSGKKVHYDVYANRFLTDDNGVKHTERIEENKRFTGKERKAALEYADKLGKKYKVEVERKYFDWR